MSDLNRLANEIEKAKAITILTGAGVSTASGIPDFRSTNGLWTLGKSREYYMSRDYFYQDPEDFWEKYKDIFRLKLVKDYLPNQVHMYLRGLELQGKIVSVVTQNVDGLHSQAGNEHVIEYHGSLNTASCPACGTNYSLTYVMEEQVPRCNQKGCGDILKPDIVLFGDPITKHHDAEAAIDQAELVLVLGTSLLVTPFNLLPQYAANQGIRLGIINQESTPMDELFDYVIQQDLIEVIHHINK